VFSHINLCPFGKIYLDALGDEVQEVSATNNCEESDSSMYLSSVSDDNGTGCRINDLEDDLVRVTYIIIAWLY